MTPAIERFGKRHVILFWATVLIGCIGTIVYVATKPDRRQPEPDRVARAEFFVNEVKPVIKETDAANHEAADRCVERINDAFDKYRQGVSPFVEDMTSWGTRWGVLRRMPSDWWNEGNDVRNYIGNKFERHLFSEKILRSDIEKALASYRKDIEANNVALLADVQAAASTADLPNFPNIDYGDFSSDVKASLQEFVANSAVDSAQNLVIVEISSGVAGAAAEYLIVAITTRLTAMAATTSATAGGATAGGAAVGGGGGSLAGPLGTGVGVVVGIAVGIIIDWWMTENFKEKLSGQLNQMIDDIETSVIEGSKNRAGLGHALDEACNALRESYQNSLRKRIVGETI